MEDWTRELEHRVGELERAFHEFERRCEGGLRLYESLVPWGVDRLMLRMIQVFARQQRDEENGVQRREWHQIWWVRGIAVLTLALQLYIAIKVK